MFWALNQIVCTPRVLDINVQSLQQHTSTDISVPCLQIQGVIESLERDMELLCMTGVEDRLQDSVRPTLEMLRNAGIKVGVSVYDRGGRQAPGQCQAYTGDAP